MGTIIEKKRYLLETKEGLRQKLIELRADVPEDTPFREYATKIRNLPISEPIEDMSYFFAGGVRMSQFDEINEKLCPYAKNMSYMMNDIGYWAHGNEPITINTDNAEDLSYLIANCDYWSYLPILTNTAKCKTMKGIMYGGGYNGSRRDISEIPLWDTSNVEDMSYAFDGCSWALFNKTGEFPPFNLQNVLTMAFMCYDCRKLKTVSILDALKCTDMESAFGVCTGLTDAVIDLAGCKSIKGIFYECTSLVNVELRNTGGVENMYNAFDTCTALANPPVLDMTSCTNARYMYIRCYAMTEIGGINAPVCLNVADMFRSCTSLRKVEGFLVPVATDISKAFQSCGALEELLNIDISSATTTSYFVRDNANLKRITFAPTATRMPSFSLLNCGLDREGMVEFFNSVPVGDGTTGVTITGNPCVKDGTLTDEDKAIIVNKNYTLTV